jgi:hypothetical protein
MRNIKDIPAYNIASHIGGTLDSVVSQLFTDFQSGNGSIRVTATIGGQTGYTHVGLMNGTFTGALSENECPDDGYPMKLPPRSLLKPMT